MSLRSQREQILGRPVRVIVRSRIESLTGSGDGAPEPVGGAR
jgi:hypothetical protein